MVRTNMRNLTALMLRIAIIRTLHKLATGKTQMRTEYWVYFGLLLVMVFVTFFTDYDPYHTDEAKSAEYQAASQLNEDDNGMDFKVIEHTEASHDVHSVDASEGTHFYSDTSLTCCVKLPRYWHKDLKVKVSWEDHPDYLKDADGKNVFDDGKETLVYHPIKTTTVLVPPYIRRNEYSQLYVHFLPNNVLKVVVFDTGKEKYSPIIETPQGNTH
jgi:hypothetical protein